MPNETQSNYPTEELVRLAKENHSNAIVQIVNRHKGMVFNLAYRILGNYHDAQEASQDTFVKAFRNINGFRADCLFSSWLYKICYNTCITYKKRNLPAVELNERIVHEKMQPQQPVFLSEHSDRKIYLNQALESLPSDDAVIVSLFYMEEMPTSEIASIVGLTETNVRVKLHRARKMLKEKLVHLLQHEAANL
ncbi:MAG TPA: sigma-70 family RNA polymerase sigma factor [Tenuifilaceae bacterium]|nr:sigma-70 family RNA polymerase sigma factor [Tenuifilaceae bacterium]